MLKLNELTKPTNHYFVFVEKLFPNKKIRYAYSALKKLMQLLPLVCTSTYQHVMYSFPAYLAVSAMLRFSNSIIVLVSKAYRGKSSVSEGCRPVSLINVVSRDFEMCIF